MKTKGKLSRLSVFVLALLVLGMLPGAAMGAAKGPVESEEVAWDGDTTLPRFVGAPAEPQPLPKVDSAQNPFMAPNPFSHDHNDTWMSDTYDNAGPLGWDPEVLSSTMTEARRDPDSPSFMCPGVTADRKGRLVLSCTGFGEWSLVLVDPATLEVLAYQHLPVNMEMAKSFGASYLYLDNQDRAVVPVANEADGTVKIQVYRTVESPGNLRFKLVSEYDVTAYVPQGDNINGVLPD